MVVNNTAVTLSWDEMTPAWNASSDKRYQECLENTEAPCIINEDDHKLTRFEYFEKEYNVSMKLTNTGEIGFQTYTLTFNTPRDLTFFTLKWL